MAGAHRCCLSTSRGAPYSVVRGLVERHAPVCHPGDCLQLLRAYLRLRVQISMVGVRCSVGIQGRVGDSEGYTPSGEHPSPGLSLATGLVSQGDVGQVCRSGGSAGRGTG